MDVANIQTTAPFPDGFSGGYRAILATSLHVQTPDQPRLLKTPASRVSTQAQQIHFLLFLCD